MKKVLIALVAATSFAAAIEAAPTDTVTQADLQAILKRISQLEAENKAQAARIAELEDRQVVVTATAPEIRPVGFAARGMDEGTTTNGTGRIWETANGQKFYLADKAAGIFQPLTESGLTFQPYGYLVLEGVYNSEYTASPMYTDWVSKKRPNHSGETSTLSVNDSILGFNFGTPELYNGWKFTGKFEFDLAGDDANHTDFHVRHLWWAMDHEETGWQILFGQTWHLWKMVTPNEIDGAWMENTGHPYRRSPQIRVTKKWNWDDSSLEARVGIVKNGPGMGGDRDDDGVQNNEQSSWCLFEGALVYDHKAFWEEEDRRWLVGIGGMYGRDKSRRPTARGEFNGPEDEYDSDLVMIAAAIPFLEKFTLTGQVFAGENLGGVQAGIGQTVGFDRYGEKGREVSTVGGFVDLRYDLNETWAFAVGYGFDDPTDSDVNRYEYAGDGEWDHLGRTFNSRTYVDAFYQFNANLHFGLEYAYLTTDYVNEGGSGDNSADDHRFQFTVYYDF